LTRSILITHFTKNKKFIPNITISLVLDEQTTL